MSIRGYKVIYSFSWLKSAQYPGIYTKYQFMTLWIHQHHLKIEKDITFICKSKIDYQHTIDNCIRITNFILSSFGTLSALYTHTNATNKKINLFTLVSLIFG
eukprot:297692_1